MVQNHPLINPIVNPADILLAINVIPKLVIANDEAVAGAAWPSLIIHVSEPFIQTNRFSIAS